MSNALLNAVFAQSKSEGLERLIMLSIADRANEQGRAYCGAADLCRRTRAGRRNVFRALKRLRESGELAILPEKGFNGCNSYVITLDQWHKDTRGIKPLVTQEVASRGATPLKPLGTPKRKTEAWPRV
jgi:hypothetical protein